MAEGPTRGAQENTWEARPVHAFAARTLLFVVPLAVSIAVVRLISPSLWHPAGFLGAAGYVAQIALVGIGTGLLAERLLRKALPLPALLNMTLVFPDKAPSRFSFALRSGSLKKLRAAAADGRKLGDQEAAELVLGLITELGHHDRRTRGHTERVRAYADLIGVEMGLSARDKQMLSWAALIHDVGKLSVPSDILELPTKPDDEQWRILRGHPEAGAALVEPLAPWLGDWRLAATEHHERWDGGGYPAGLAGNDISLAGRIVAVADAFDVMTSQRSYKSPCSYEAAREELVRCSGTQFDPQVVRAFLQASLGLSRSRLNYFGWLFELVAVSVPRGVGQTVAAGGAAASIVVGVATTGPIVLAPKDEVVAAVIDPQPVALAFDVDDLPTAPPTTTGTTAVTIDTTASTEAETTTSASTTTTETSTSSTTTTTAPQTTTTTAAPATQPPTTPAPTTTTTAAPTTTTTAPTTTTTAPPAGQVLYLKNPGSGNSSAQWFKRLEAGGLDDGSQPNFDTNRDSIPGLSLAATTNGWGETDLARIQRYGMNPSQDLDGPASATVYLATETDRTASPVPVRLSINDCNNLYQSCTILADGVVSVGNPVAGGFQPFTVNFGTLNHNLGGGRRLVLILITEEGETIHTGFDATPNPSSLTVTWD
ncbi:MAG: HD-GYP domain-containing protein [Actinomycetota bacterium]